MKRFALALFVALAAASSPASADYGMPSGTFTCTLLMAQRLTGTSADEFVPSILGTTTLDGRGGYVRREGGVGSVAVEGGHLKFTSGEMAGIVAVWKRDPRGRSYLHIDGEVSTPPSGDPKPADFVCYQQ
jgi:hypothetical protein